MFNLGLFELTLFGVIALIVLGPDKLPQAMRTLGKWYGMIMHAKNRLQNDILNELQLAETQEELKKELAKLKLAESEMKAQMQELQGAVNQNRRELLRFDNDNTDDEPTWDDETPWEKKKHKENHFNFDTPMQGAFFLLGDYDKARRLPPAPRLPNTRADPLLTPVQPNPNPPDQSNKGDV